jgi:HAD superfamily hydrolase (TIGR01509 family)
MTSTSTLSLAAIAFDLGNVLVRVDHGRFCQNLAEVAGLSPEEVFKAVFASDLEPAFDTGRLSPQEFYRQIMDHFRVALPYPQFCDLWNDIFDPMGGMEEVVEHLKRRYALFMLSNTNPLHFHYIRANFPVVRHFQQCLLSYEVGSRKPEGEIYQALISRAAQPPERILYLDDKLPFVEAARAKGLVAWQFTSPPDLKRQLRQHDLW